MKIITNSLAWFDKLQRRRRLLGFSVAVIKKYSEDQAGRQAALLTYYGFLALFPLLLVLTTITTLIASSHPQLQQQIIKGTTIYFPVLGDQLSAHVHSLHQTGPALLVGILFTFYGAHGVADVFRGGVNHVWAIPFKQRLRFPKSTFNSLEIMIVGGVGFITASVITGLTAAAGHGLIFRLAALAVNLCILYWLFQFLLTLSLPRQVPFRETRAGALAAAIGLVILQVAGGYLLKRELQNLDALYSSFALSLGLLFWIYLQAQVVYYSVEISAVHAQKLWPRSLSGHQQTDGDERAQRKHLSQTMREY